MHRVTACSSVSCIGKQGQPSKKPTVVQEKPLFTLQLAKTSSGKLQYYYIPSYIPTIASVSVKDQVSKPTNVKKKKKKVASSM